MKRLEIGDKLQIQCYKHNGKIHRFWDEAVIIDVNEEYIVCGNNKTKVVESDGTIWNTREPAVMYFFKNRWFNIISQLKKDGVYYYCNIASPAIIEDETIKYIDYDLDLRIFPSGNFKILDKKEYEYHKKIMSYGDNLEKTIIKGLIDLLEIYGRKEVFFVEKNNVDFSNKYFQIKNKKSIDN